MPQAKKGMRPSLLTAGEAPLEEADPDAARYASLGIVPYTTDTFTPAFSQTFPFWSTLLMPPPPPGLAVERQHECEASTSSTALYCAPLFCAAQRLLGLHVPDSSTSSHSLSTTLTRALKPALMHSLPHTRAL